MSKRPHLAAGLLVVAFAITGCSEPTPPEPSPPVPTATPAFADDAAALAAATEAYEAYLEIGSQIANDGGNEPERISEVVAGEALITEYDIFDSMVSTGVRGEGTQTADGYRIQYVDMRTGEIGIYLCLDTAGSDLVDVEGQSTLDPRRPTRYPLAVVFRRTEDALKLVSSESWTGDNFC